MFARPVLAALLAGLIAVSAVACGSNDTRPNGSVGAVIKGLENPFFGAMRDGLVETARRYGTPLRVAAAAGLEDTAGQASKLESLIADNAACYVVNPINRTNLAQSLGHIPDRTPIVNIDSPVGKESAAAVGAKITTYIGTDNVAAGRLAADAMAAFVHRQATVAVIAGIPGDASSGARTEGFTHGARGRFDVVATSAADFERGKARLAAEAVLRREPAIKGFFAVNDEMALGVAEAVRAAGRAGKVAVVGVDGIRQALAAVKSGALSATVAQYPYTIGQLGLEACLVAMRGKPLPARLDAPITVVTRDNVTRAQADFPKPSNSFRSPLRKLLETG
jgi:ABC-type sugar transport system substrate-binding protein